MSARLTRLWLLVEEFGRRPIAIVVPGLLAVVVRLALLPALPIPEARIHDEFSYLLQADTFSRGRLANPTHPHWESFQTMHVLSQPTYASRYPPAQGFFMAIGRVLTGFPFFGVLIAFGLMSSAVFWMLRGWTTPGFAVVGGLLWICVFGPAHYWANSYWGGAIAALGAALVLGAFGRILQRAQLSSALALGAGACVLWFSRLFEGGFLVLAVGGTLLFLLVKKILPRAGVGRFIAVLGVWAAAVLIVQGYYDWRVTGSARTMPYTLYTQYYMRAPVMWAQAPLTPARQAAPAVAAFHDSWEFLAYKDLHTMRPGPRAAYLLGRFLDLIGGIFSASRGRLIGVPMLLLLSGSLAFAREDREIRLLWVAFFSCSIPLILESWNQFHYAAPIYVVMFALLFRTLWRFRQGGRPLLAKATPWLVAFMFAFALVFSAGRAYRDVRAPRDGYQYQRARLVKELQTLGGKHLVFAHYSASHSVHDEWVYNSADIDGQSVVWAQDLSEDLNGALIRYYPDRSVWRVDADDPHPVPRAVAR